MKSYFKKIKF